MTLLRELAIYLTILLLILLAGSLALNVRDARQYLQLQLQSHAQDTAGSLGVAIAATEPDNLAVIDSMIDAVFDQGHYRVIRFSNMEGKVLVNSEHSVEVEGVPEWFVRWVVLDAPEINTEINRRWIPVGKLTVGSHPGHAYRSLWSKLQASFYLFGGVFLIAMLGLCVLLNIILRPLGRMERQADAICQRHFEVQPILPRTRDLRKVVEAMNRMAIKLEKLFNDEGVLTEELRRKSVKDPLTGTLNRQAFEDRIVSALSQEKGEAGGSLMIVLLNGLDPLNRIHGRSKVDALLVDIGRRITKAMELWPQAFVGRRTGAEFTVFIPACSIEDNRKVSEAVFRELASLPIFVTREGQDRLHLASVTYMGRCQPEDLFAHTDQLLRALQMNVGNAWKVLDVTSKRSSPIVWWNEQQWRQALQKVFADKDLELFAQQVFSREQKPLFREIYARLHLGDELASAEAFLPMVERLGLHAEFDKAVVSKLLLHMEHTEEQQEYCINLSPQSFLDDVFFDWLLEVMTKHTAMARRLVIETSERTLLLAGERLKEKVEKLVTTGCRFSIDQFGIASQTLVSLHNLDIHYLKVDGSFVQNISQNHGNQLYIHTLRILAEIRDIKLFAQGIESADDWSQLQKLGVQGGQGYYLGRPEKL